KFLDSSVQNLNDALKKQILVGEGGSTIEQGLDAMNSVLTNNYVNEQGVPFLRSDSFLNIIALSNEDDSSQYEWKYYAEFLNKLRPDFEDGSKSWALHFFGVLSLNDSCPSGDWSFYKSPGYKYMELANYSSGFTGSICGNDLYKSLSAIKARVIQVLTDYKLKDIPDLSTLRVYINDQLVPEDINNGWSYIRENNVIRFNGNYVPKSDDSIRVDFKPAEAQ
ncbi:MAG: hypothetical protein KDD45_06980, partial [Bdellovibrionales bacterium]|nr:hypothetical protein [Bdellovibrionales bacterium]